MIDWKNILTRALWTFLEAFLVALPATNSFDKSALLSAACAGLSAVKTFIIELIKAHKKNWMPPDEE